MRIMSISLNPFPILERGPVVNHRAVKKLVFKPYKNNNDNDMSSGGYIKMVLFLFFTQLIFHGKS